jgi:hypothetical protein
VTVPFSAGIGAGNGDGGPASVGRFPTKEKTAMTTAVLDDFDLDIRIGDSLDNEAMFPPPFSVTCGSEVGCPTDSGLGCGGGGRTVDSCPTESCRVTHCEC